LGREVPAVVMTGDAAADIGKPPAHTDFLQKPFEIDDLMLLIERAVSLRARD
jgi:FixJ family two-component response regulator